MTTDAPLGYEALRSAWEDASRIVQARPWLNISWIAHPGEPPHLVVHDGAVGASLHFDDEAGPAFASEIGLRSLDWEDTAVGDADWMVEWGPVDLQPEVTAKSAAYLLLGALVAAGPTWSVRPAPLIADEDDESSIYALRDRFPSIAATVDSYVDLLGVQYREGEIANRSEYWHEPIWLVERDGAATALVDEAGFVHVERPSPRRIQLVRTPRDLDELAARISTSAQQPAQTETAHARPASRDLRVYLDFASILEADGLDCLGSRLRDRGEPESHDLAALMLMSRDFASVFGAEWWSTGLPGSRHQVSWTLFIGTDGGSWSDLLTLASAESFVEYFFTGGRLLADRFFDGEGCDLLVTRGDTSRIRSSSTEILRVGAPGTEDWHAVAEAIARRLPTAFVPHLDSI
ncbi:MAG: hypothetical protein K0S70_241 [Microbacterium sp.]|jgi:hypothetical protein|nr:hypothetical protein [Microbacterium sp.]